MNILKERKKKKEEEQINMMNLFEKMFKKKRLEYKINKN